jgi:hypothetical protein
MGRIRGKLSYSNVMATIAVFLALGTGSFAIAKLAKKSVGTAQLKNGAVNAKKLKNKAVTNAKLGGAAVTGSKIASSAVGDSKLASGAVTSTKIAAGAVGTTQIADGSVTRAKVSDDAIPLLGTLRSGQTLRGAFNFGGSAGSATTFRTGASFQFPLLEPLSAANATVVSVFPDPNDSAPGCPGLTGGNLQTPQADPGHLCVYWTTKTGSAGIDAEPSIEGNALTRLGFGLIASSDSSGIIQFAGLWAVTAP